MSSSHHDHPGLAPPWVSEVADGVFAYVQPDGSWWINNTGFVRGERSVLSIDTCSTERRTRAYLSKVEEIAGRTPGMLVNTHHHGDHTNGNCLTPYATVIGHEKCREEMIKSGIMRLEGVFEPVEWGDISLVPPFVTFDEHLDVYVDDLKVELIHLTSAAHTTNDVVAWIPEHRVMFAGDLVFNGGTPFVVMGSVAGSLEALSRIMEMEPLVVVPGHGAPGGMETVVDCGAYLRWLQQSAEEAVAAELTPLEAARQLDLGEFAGLLDAERLVGNLHRAFAECRGAGWGDPIDIPAAFADMITLNGGRPLRCMA
jgi:cyclase